jgi:hypothetical protein
MTLVRRNGPEVRFEDIASDSRPGKLKEWLEGEGLTRESRQHPFTDAGQLIPRFSLGEQEVEFFVHSPFGKWLSEVEVIDRNIDSLVVQATFTVNGVATRVLLGSDLEHTAISDIVDVTRAKKRDERLESDVIKLWHHCSYTAIGPEKGEEKTEPVEQVKWIFEEKLHRLEQIVEEHSHCDLARHLNEVDAECKPIERVKRQDVGRCGRGVTGYNETSVYVSLCESAR